MKHKVICKTTGFSFTLLDSIPHYKGIQREHPLMAANQRRDLLACCRRFPKHKALVASAIIAIGRDKKLLVGKLSLSDLHLINLSLRGLSHQKLAAILTFIREGSSRYITQLSLEGLISGLAENQLAEELRQVDKTVAALADAPASPITQAFVGVSEWRAVRQSIRLIGGQIHDWMLAQTVEQSANARDDAGLDRSKVEQEVAQSALKTSQPAPRFGFIDPKLESDDKILPRMRKIFRKVQKSGKATHIPDLAFNNCYKFMLQYRTIDSRIRQKIQEYMLAISFVAADNPSLLTDKEFRTIEVLLDQAKEPEYNWETKELEDINDNLAKTNANLGRGC